MSDLKRVNVRITPELHEWYKRESERTGLTVNALMVTALNAYYNQQVVIPNIPKLMEMYEQLNRLTEKNSSVEYE